MEQWTMDNTQGYAQAELDALNAELAVLLADLEPYTDAWYATAKHFADTVATR